MTQKGRQERVRMRSERWRLLGGNLLTSLSMSLALSPNSSRPWGIVENNGAGHLKLLVARSYKRGKAICGGMRCLSVKQKSHRETSQQINAKFNTREALNIYTGRLHHKVALSSGIRLNLSSS